LALTVLSLAVLLSITIGAAIENGGPFAYVTNSADSTVSVINTANNNIEATVIVGKLPFGTAVSPDGTKVYVANSNSNNVSVIDTTKKTVPASMNVGKLPVSIGKIVMPFTSSTPVANLAAM
jgi:YVTN family beta-propeller protein